MKRVLVILASFLFLGIRAYAYDDGDFQVWNTEVEEYNINNNFKIALEEEFRWGGNTREFYYQHYDLGLFYGMNKYWSLGGGYRQVYELSKSKFKLENEPYLAANFILSGAGLILNDRNRLEYRHFDYKADSGRYRNKFTLSYPLKFLQFEAHPFISDEIFFSFGGTNQFSQNRISCGAGVNLTRNIKFEIYYMLLTAKSSGKWMDSNVLGTKFRMAL